MRNKILGPANAKYHYSYLFLINKGDLPLMYSCAFWREFRIDLVVFNSWGRASVPRVIAGTRICKLVPRPLVVDGHRAEASPNSRVRRSIVSEEAHARRSSVSSNSYENVHRSLLRLGSFLCGKFSTARLEVLPNLRHAGVFQMSTMVNFGIGLTRRWAFALRLRKITGDIQIPAWWKVIWKWENIMSCYS